MDALRHFFVDIKRGSFSPDILPDDQALMSRFKGCLAGALVGDCLGLFFECVDCRVKNIDPLEFCADVEGSLKIWKATPKFSDDSVFTNALAESLLLKDGYDEIDFAKRYVEAVRKHKGRHYGSSVDAFCKKLEESKFADPKATALEMFCGTGSLGNGAAMRIAPLALLHFDDTDKLVKVAEECGRTTHGHRLAYHGAVLIALAIQIAMHLPSDSRVSPEPFLDALKSKMAEVEGDLPAGPEPEADSVGGLMSTVSYVRKLDQVKEVLANDASLDVVRVRVGNDVHAHRSVPTAIYCFLKAQNPIKGFYSNSPMERAIALALSLGGDTDTIATMAAAICGAHVGFAGVPKTWFEKCEDHEKRIKLAEKLYAMYKRHKNAKPKRNHCSQPRVITNESPRFSEVTQ